MAKMQTKSAVAKKAVKPFNLPSKTMNDSQKKAVDKDATSKARANRRK